MASLRQRRGTWWYARVQWWFNQNRREINIPLRTKKKIVARERLSEVEKVEEYIKEGNKFNFPWLSNSTTTTVVRLTISDAVDKWINERRHMVRTNTIVINKNSLSHFKNALGCDMHLSSIDEDSILFFIKYLNSITSSIASINIHLRVVKTMLRYYQKIGALNKVPSIELIKVYKKDPVYITDNEFSSIMDLSELPSFYKRLFLFYRETGMRLREPFITTLNGNWLDISSESKSHVGRSMEINSYLKTIYKEYMNWLKKGYGKNLKDPGDHISKLFKKCLVRVDASIGKSFHSLRHTFAVRSLIKGVPIYNLKLLMGHSSVVTTEEYSNMNLKRVAYDFPSISFSLAEDKPRNHKEDTLMEDTHHLMNEYVNILPHLEG